MFFFCGSKEIWGNDPISIFLDEGVRHRKEHFSSVLRNTVTSVHKRDLTLLCQDSLSHLLKGTGAELES
jgi:hypothetical protein